MAAIRWKLHGKPEFDFRTLQKNKRRELERLSDTYKNNLEQAEVHFIEGRGKLIDQNTVEVDGSQYKVRLFMPFAAISHQKCAGPLHCSEGIARRGMSRCRISTARQAITHMALEAA